ncbi:MAG TPA: antitoxin Xre-like helix-turn-helix domain-containing protein [Nevskiaceae bacterium]
MPSRLSVECTHTSSLRSSVLPRPIRPEDVRRGLPASRIDGAAAAGIDRGDVLRLIGANSTIRRRIRDQGVLTRAESDRLARVVRILQQAMEAFGSNDKATRWLARP